MDYSARASYVISCGTCRNVDEPQSFVAMVSGYSELFIHKVRDGLLAHSAWAWR